MPIEVVALEQQLQAIPEYDRWAARPELQDLAAIMNSGERITAGVQGMLIESGKLAMRTWLIIATNNRLLCLLKNGSASLRKVELPIGIMKAAYTDSKLGHHDVIVESSAAKIVISRMSKDAAVSLSSALTLRIKQIQEAAAWTAAQPAAPTAAGPIASSAELTLTDEVRRLNLELEQTKKRLTIVEDFLKRAAAKAKEQQSATAADV
ncbi:MAG TPA: PH domain-containing protein [Longimicrobiales bacterium]|nr:PH domain-containing protein [Longimicrobiales bacterium]